MSVIEANANASGALIIRPIRNTNECGLHPRQRGAKASHLGDMARAIVTLDRGRVSDMAAHRDASLGIGERVALLL
jgi:hypothetical protein